MDTQPKAKLIKKVERRRHKESPARIAHALLMLLLLLPIVLVTSDASSAGHGDVSIERHEWNRIAESEGYLPFVAADEYQLPFEQREIAGKPGADAPMSVPPVYESAMAFNATEPAPASDLQPTIAETKFNQPAHVLIVTRRAEDTRGVNSTSTTATTTTSSSPAPVSSAVPEPTTAVWLIGACMLAMGRRRRAKPSP